MPQDGFAAQVGAWCQESKDRILAVRNESAQRVVDVMLTPVGAGGRLRVDTGFLRASLRAAIGDPQFSVTLNPKSDGTYTYDGAEVALTISSATINDLLSFVFTANYAIPREYGARGQPPDAFVRMAAQQWPRIVSEVATEAQAGRK